MQKKLSAVATKIPIVLKLITSFEWTETEGKKIFCFKLSVTSIIEGVRVCALGASVSNSRQSRMSVWKRDTDAV